MSSGMTIGLLGFGEVGQTLADDLANVTDATLYTFDVLFPDRESIPARALADRSQVAATENAASLGGRCNIIISAVTAAEDIVAARSISDGLAKGAFVMDLNSVAPETKRRCAEIIDAAGGRYIEAAVMSPIHPEGSASPILLGGPNAAEFLGTAHALGFTGASVFSSEIGPASATKMCRSVIIKGVEALLSESLLAARHYGVEKEVLDSLGNVLTTKDWPALAHYLIGRAVKHGVRRAEEMREAATTVSAAGLEPLMSNACVARQQWTAQFSGALEEKSLPGMLDAIRRDLVC
ncbi:MAG: DUF1932 domain-containing protein [Gammaproteobacteria bacterium]|nr:DUF1932 domain-containing protein [Gammaproteobacteria bacterium]